MIKLFITAALFLALNTVYGQKMYNLDVKKESTVSYKKTEDVAIYKGEKKPVYISKNGKLFIFVTSQKTGKEYKKYLN